MTHGEHDRARAQAVTGRYAQRMTTTEAETLPSLLPDVRDVPLAAMPMLMGAALAAVQRVVPGVQVPVPVAAFQSSVS